MNRYTILLSLLILTVPVAGWAAPLRIYILAGQSNMQGHAHVRTLEHIGMDPSTKPMLDEILNADGTSKVCDRVWIASLGSDDVERTGKLTTGYGASQGGPKIGPELTFGIAMQKLVDGPILIIKTAWGGKSLNTDFRSPSAGPYVFNETQLANFKKEGKDIDSIKAEKEKATGVNYRLMIDYVRNVTSDIKRVVPTYDETQGYELAGFVWLQGWNDMVDSSTYPNRDKPGGYDEYSRALTHFIRDVRVDLVSPKLPFVIGVMGIGGPVEEYGPEQLRYKETHRNFRLAMAAPAEVPEFLGNVIAVKTEIFWDQELGKAKLKNDTIRQNARKLATQSKMPASEEQALVEKMLAEGLTERERTIIEKGISNFEFHYLGSAKILGRIGQGLAEALVDLEKRR